MWNYVREGIHVYVKKQQKLDKRLFKAKLRFICRLPTEICKSRMHGKAGIY